MTDNTGKVIEIGMAVLVPEPNDSDIHNHGFVGNVEAFHGEYVVVIDGEGDCFDIEPERLEIQDEDKRVVIDVFNTDDWCIHDANGQLVEDNFVSYNEAFAWATLNDYDVVEKINVK